MLLMGIMVLGSVGIFVALLGLARFGALLGRSKRNGAKRQEKPDASG